LKNTLPPKYDQCIVVIKTLQFICVRSNKSDSDFVLTKVADCGCIPPAYAALPSKYTAVRCCVTLTLQHESKDDTKQLEFGREDIPADDGRSVRYEVVPIKYMGGGDTLHIIMCQGSRR
jgi:hypothetical protein